MDRSTMTQQEGKAKFDQFQEWLAKPETKYFISKLPPSDDPDLVRTVLEFAFRAGFDGGAGFTAQMVVARMFSGRRDRE